MTTSTAEQKLLRRPVVPRHDFLPSFTSGIPGPRWLSGAECEHVDIVLPRQNPPMGGVEALAHIVSTPLLLDPLHPADTSLIRSLPDLTSCKPDPAHGVSPLPSLLRCAAGYHAPPNKALPHGYRGAEVGHDRQRSVRAGGVLRGTLGVDHIPRTASTRHGPGLFVEVLRV